MCRVSGNVLLLINYFRLKLMNISLNQTYRRWIIVSITNIIIANDYTHTNDDEVGVESQNTAISSLDERSICRICGTSASASMFPLILSERKGYSRRVHCNMAHGTSNTSQSCISFRYTHYSFTHTHTTCIWQNNELHSNKRNAIRHCVWLLCAGWTNTFFFLVQRNSAIVQHRQKPDSHFTLPFVLDFRCTEWKHSQYIVLIVDAKILHVHLS